MERKQQQQVCPDVRGVDEDHVKVYGQEEDGVSSLDANNTQGDPTVKSVIELWRYIQAKEREIKAKERDMEVKKLEIEIRECVLNAERKVIDNEASRYVTLIKDAYPRSSHESLDTKLKKASQSARQLIWEIQRKSSQQHQITSLNQEIDKLEEQLKLTMITIRILESLQETTPDHEGRFALEELQNEAKNLTSQIEQLKMRLAKTEDNDKKWDLKKPEYEDPPAGFQRDRKTLQKKRVSKIINMTFNPAENPNVKLEDVWTMVLRYGKDNYLNEQEHLDVLEHVLGGEPHKTYLECIVFKKFDLRRTLERLYVMYVM